MIGFVQKESIKTLLEEAGLKLIESDEELIVFEHMGVRIELGDGYYADENGNYHAATEIRTKHDDVRLKEAYKEVLLEEIHKRNKGLKRHIELRLLGGYK